jgi:type VI protein secretion system component Hcp
MKGLLQKLIKSILQPLDNKNINNKKPTIMRTIILALLLSPLLSIAQRTDVYIKLTDAGGLQIKGESVTKGFERWIVATAITSSGKNNTQLNFTMTVSGASADLKKAMANGKPLLNGQVTVTVLNPSGGAPLTSYTIKMENILVTTCYEAMGCNNIINTTVMLQATRIGWTYYTTSGGTQTVSRKFGWDGEANKEWMNF